MPHQLELNKLHLLNTIDKNIEGYVFYQLLTKTDGSSKFIYISDQIRKYNENSIDDIKENPNLLYDRVHPDYINGLLLKQKEAFNSLDIFHYEFPLYINENELRWLSVTSVPVKLENDDIIWNGIQIDVTENKIQELKIKKQNRILLLLNSINDKILTIHDIDELLDSIIRSIVENGSYQLVWMCIKPDVDSTDQRIKVYKAYGVTDYLKEIYIDLSDETMSNGPTATALNKGIVAITNNMTEAENFKPWLYKARQYGLSSSAVLPMQFLDKRATINIYSSEIDSFDEDEVKLLERIVSNISNAINALHTENEKKKASKLLEEKINELNVSQANLQTIFNHTKIRYALIDSEFNLVMYNNSFKSDFQKLNNKDVKIGDNFLEKLPLGRQAEILQKINQVKENKINKFEFELKYEFDSVQYYVSAIYLPVYVNNEINAFLIISEDITERKKYELERQVMIDDLILRNKKLEEFAFIVSHVLRAPVANILGLNSLIIEDPDSKDKYLELLNQSVQKLDSVIRELNDVLQKSTNKKAPQNNLEGEN